eukprot:scaffold405_cov243-Pinguiococcus_pyrenoidosus.AAC.22
MRHRNSIRLVPCAAGHLAQRQLNQDSLGLILQQAPPAPLALLLSDVLTKCLGRPANDSVIEKVVRHADPRDDEMEPSLKFFLNASATWRAPRDRIENGEWGKEEMKSRFSSPSPSVTTPYSGFHFAT